MHREGTLLSYQIREDAKVVSGMTPWEPNYRSHEQISVLTRVSDFGCMEIEPITLFLTIEVGSRREHTKRYNSAMNKEISIRLMRERYNPCVERE